MNFSAEPSNIKMSSSRRKSPGWAAFDLKLREKQGEIEIDKDPFPPIPSALTTLSTLKTNPRNDGLSEKSFSSVLLPAVNFPTVQEDRDSHKPTHVGDSCAKFGSKVTEKTNHDLAFQKLKELHCWADDSLIKDVLAAVDYNIDTASTLLKGMGSSDKTEENKERDFLVSNSNGSQCAIVSNAEPIDLSFSFEECLKLNDKALMDDAASCGRRHFDAAADKKVFLGQMQLTSLPVEPEWEEEDVYLSHRKDAIKMMRSASRHSKEAANAFLRGDHFSAQQHSKKAREQWLAAQKLNAKAAKEILSIRNSENDIWKLDLHGLHAAEAIEALKEHLQKIETRASVNRSVSPNRIGVKERIVRSSSLESFTSIDISKLDKQQASSVQKSTLQIITGVGNHSRGQAALPTAVKSFLIENGYRFDEVRPGVITVRLKFRHR